MYVMPKSDKQVSIRLPQDFVKRAEKLAKTLKDAPEYRYVPRVGLSFVLKLAIEKGLGDLEEQHAPSPRRR